MIILYCFIVIVLIVPSGPFLYIKSIANAVYICFKRTRQDYPGQNLLWLAQTLLLGPIIIIFSFIIDLIAMPTILLRPQDTFEHKYQLSNNNLTFEQMF